MRVVFSLATPSKRILLRWNVKVWLDPQVLVSAVCSCATTTGFGICLEAFLVQIPGQGGRLNQESVSGLIPSCFVYLPSDLFQMKYMTLFSSGANFVEDSSGKMLHLDRLSDLKRRGVAARLLATPGQKVRRGFVRISTESQR